MDSVLITGSTGFIGGHLVRRMCERYRVVCPSRQSGCDLSQPGWINQLPDEPVDCVIHLAQSRQYRNFPAGAADMLAVNVDSTLQLAEWARNHHVKTFIYASTGSVYPLTHESTICKETDVAIPQGFYPATKYAAELLLKPYAAYYNVILPRFFGVYGPGSDTVLIMKMIKAVEEGRTITLAQDNGIYITPVFVEDCASVLEQLCNKDPRNSYELFNVAGNEVLSLKEICEMIALYLNKKARFVMTSDNVSFVCGDNNKLRRFLDWEPVSFSDGMTRTMVSEGYTRA